MQNYYNEVENYIKKCEVNKKARRYEEENEKVKTYWHIGRLIVEAQGGEKRAKYGNNLIKEWSVKLTAKYGNGYNISSLKRFRKFYLTFEKGATLSHQLSWSQIQEVLPIKDHNKQKYYINLCISKNLSIRELRKEIKLNSYERLLNKPEKLELVLHPKITKIKDNLKNPIIIELNEGETIANEHDLEMYLLAKLKCFFNQLGEGFTLVGNQYKIDNYYIDILLFNYIFNAFIVVELKVRNLQKEDKVQVEFYMNLVDKKVKKEFHNKTLGIIISKNQDKFVAEFVGSESLYPLTYEIIK